MGAYSGPKIETDGLVFALDVGNIFKSVDSTSNNFLQNGSFAGGLGVTYEAGSNQTNTIIELENPGDSNYVLRQNGSNTEYQMNIDGGAQGTLSASTQYVISGWYATSDDYNGADTMFHSRAFSTSGSHNSTGNGIGTLLYSVEIGGLTWEYRYATTTTPSDYNGDFDWYMGFGTTNTAGYRYYTGLKVEEGSFPFLLDLSGNGNDAKVINGPTFSSDNGGSIVFDGTNDRVSVEDNSLLDIVGDKSLSCWVYMGANNNGCGIAGKMSSSDNGMALGYGFNGNGFMALAWNIANSPFIVKDLSRDITKWVYLTAVQSGTTRIIYAWDILGLRSSSYSGGGHTWNNNLTFSLGGKSGGGSGVPGSTRIAQTSIYNKALTAAEVQQNYNATRSRYGV